MPQQLDCKLSSASVLLSVLSAKKKKKTKILLKQTEEMVHFYIRTDLSEYVLLGRAVGRKA